MKHAFIVALWALTSTSASAYYPDGTYGQIYLSGMARDSWPHNPAGEAYAMICNVRGPASSVSIRACPGTNCGSNRDLKPLAIVTVDTRFRQGNWVRVVNAHRSHDEFGRRLQDGKSLYVQGWVHDNFLCDFLD